MVWVKKYQDLLYKIYPTYYRHSIDKSEEMFLEELHVSTNDCTETNKRNNTVHSFYGIPSHNTDLDSHIVATNFLPKNYCKMTI